MPDVVSLIPDARILVAITHNPMKPVDALCELIDNAIDSFIGADRMGRPVASPCIEITLPKAADVESGIGAIVVRDNGPGLTKDQARNAVTAGFSSHDPFSNMGLFGLGFNIATGKIGRKTVFETATSGQGHITTITIDFDRMLAKNTFDAQRGEQPKPSPDYSGTVVRISEWWKPGSQNAGFINRLVRLSVPGLCWQLGRRYGSLIREKGVRITVNNVDAQPHRFCVWGDQRFVEHRLLGKIPAVVRFDEIIATELRCFVCEALIENGKTHCQTCPDGGRVKTREKRIKGWVGIQRFDSINLFGIDVIRMGRVIREQEKEAFFTWVNERGERIIDYPIDGIYGRIVGEVHIDHVPTDFLKQDFQRTSSDWYEVMKFLRGESTLQPTKRDEWNEPENDSPIYKLYQGYRRVRDLGTRDMYMGYWPSPTAKKPDRVSRKIEEELYQRFLNGEQGYVDDSEWWKLVEQADQRPKEDIKECPGCGEQSLAAAEVCLGCGHIFFGKTCMNEACGREIARSAAECSACGTNQLPQQDRPWKCALCGRENPPATMECRGCHKARGAPNVFDEEYLLAHSEVLSDLSHTNFSMKLPGEVFTQPLPIEVRRIGDGITLERDGYLVPAIFKQGSAGIRVFLNVQHPLFTTYQDRFEDVISIELARFFIERNQSQVGDYTRPLWSPSSIYWQIQSTMWGEKLELDGEETTTRILSFFSRLREELPLLFEGEGQAIWENLEPRTQGEIAKRVVQNSIDIGKLPQLVASSSFLSYLSEDLIAELFAKYPSKFFDNKFWTDAYDSINLADTESVAQIRSRIVRKYQNFLSDIAAYVDYKNPDTDYTRRADQTLALLERNISPGKARSAVGAR